MENPGKWRVNCYVCDISESQEFRRWWRQPDETVRQNVKYTAQKNPNNIHLTTVKHLTF